MVSESAYSTSRWLLIYPTRVICTWERVDCTRQPTEETAGRQFSPSHPVAGHSSLRLLSLPQTEAMFFLRQTEASSTPLQKTVQILWKRPAAFLPPSPQKSQTIHRIPLGWRVPSLG